MPLKIKTHFVGRGTVKVYIPNPNNLSLELRSYAFRTLEIMFNFVKSDVMIKYSAHCKSAMHYL